MYVQPPQQLEQLYMPEVQYIPPPPPTGIYVRRAHSDVTDLSSTSTKRTQEESNLTDPPSTTTTTPSSSTTAPHKRIAGRHSVPSPQTRDGKRECMVCKKRFKKLEDHLWTHSPEPKPHKCRAGYTLGRPTCQYVNMGFARVADRNRHELKHYDGRFVCPFGAANCRVGSERFGRLDTFKRHLRIVHGVQTASSSATDTTAAAAAQEEDDLNSRAPAGPGRPRRRSRGVKNTASYEKLECSNCSKHYYGVDAFFAHLNECTYALMHPNEADVDSAGVLGHESE
ncbi:hypothetical protein BZA70DRAFT_274124 [Myxozyma melibiosi]|uniref:C2H2-type domain-containing protein n=1 Tax=Myxozyma melibiosi TaxID=54550 RepID=A0ABR1FFD4_9ASCO